MSPSGLAGRLQRIRAAEQIRKNAQDAEWNVETIPKAESGLSGKLPGWNRTAEFLFERVSEEANTGWRNTFSAQLPLLFPRERATLEEILGEPNIWSRLVFFDLETTGLSHGAGTVAFMAGLARFDGAGRTGHMRDSQPVLRIHQLLLADYPGEAAFLSRFAELAGDDPIFVSFNGKCFDSQILMTRFLMNGLRPGCMRPEILHLDLLFPARRLWKQELGSCRLSVIEDQILGTGRVDDLPGSEAPDAWFEYLREGKQKRLLAIGEHNQKDCVSLVRLLYALDTMIGEGRGRAALIRALDLRASRDYLGARQFLEPLADTGDPIALRLLAIDTEHRIDDLEKALACAEQLGESHRVDRIRGKMLRRGIFVPDAEAADSADTDGLFNS